MGISIITELETELKEDEYEWKDCMYALDVLASEEWFRCGSCQQTWWPDCCNCHALRTIETENPRNKEDQLAKDRRHVDQSTRDFFQKVARIDACSRKRRCLRNKRLIRNDALFQSRATPKKAAPRADPCSSRRRRLPRNGRKPKRFACTECQQSKCDIYVCRIHNSVI